MFPESSHEIYFLGVRSNGMMIQFGVLLFLLARFQRLRGKTHTFDGIHVCIQLRLSGGYKHTSKSLENRRGFYFKYSWVIEETARCQA